MSVKKGCLWRKKDTKYHQKDNISLSRFNLFYSFAFNKSELKSIFDSSLNIILQYSCWKAVKMFERTIELESVDAPSHLVWVGPN